MEKFFNIMALFSLPITVVVCWTWLQGRKLLAAAQRDGFSNSFAQLAADVRELRARVETLETIATLGDSGYSRRRVDVISRDDANWQSRADLRRTAPSPRD